MIQSARPFCHLLIYLTVLFYMPNNFAQTLTLSTLVDLYPERFSKDPAEFKKWIGKSLKAGDFSLWRSFPRYYRHLYQSGISVPDIEINCVGDLHPLNFGFVYTESEIIGDEVDQSKQIYLPNDFDEMGKCLLEEELIRFFV